MVGWYDPKQLWNTAGMMIVSTVFGNNADQRLTNASLTVQRVYDYSKQLKKYRHGFMPIDDEIRDDIWIDYVADTGDGWDTTALVAHHIAAGNMPNSAQEKHRGEILIFGGDEVYPTASHKDYCERLIAPFETAAEAAGITNKTLDEGQKADLKEMPHIFAIPGNHDWYDSLNAFRYIFCAPYFNDRVFAGGWRTRQHRSYFALKLPHDWWLFGVDLQLTHNIDWPQLEYFRNIVHNEKRNGKRIVEGPEFNPGSKVIVCTPEPLWVEEEKYKSVNNETPYEKEKLNLPFLENMIRERKSEVRIYLAGDSHHYRRFATNDDRYQKITAGGGGTFLHPTHDIGFKRFKEDNGNEFELKSSYPDVDTSRFLAYGNLKFLLKNWKFGGVTAALYAIVVWLFHGSLKANVALNGGKINIDSWRGAAVQTLQDIITAPWVVVVVAVLVAGLIFFTDSNSKLQKYLGGSLHAAAHLVAIFFIGWYGYTIYQYFVAGTSFDVTFGSAWAGALTTISFSFVIGWIVGSFIMGFYLLLSLQSYGRHGNEAFSSLKIKDYKNFLRLHVTKNGVEIFPIGIREVPKWDDTTITRPGDKCYPTLIEDPIKVSA